jgi:phospholipase C
VIKIHIPQSMSRLVCTAAALFCLPAMLLFSGCSGGPKNFGSPNPAPTVTISANPTTIAPGASSTLTVAAANATSVTVTGTDGSSYTLQASGGTQKVSPSATTTYTATASGAGGTVTATATVTMGSTPAPTVTISASPASVSAGGTSTLTVKAANATTVTLTGSDGSKYTLGANGGTQAVSPASSTTYTVTATGSGGTATASATVTVTTTAAPTVTITANPSSVSAATTSLLTITATNATQVTVNGSDGSTYSLAANGGTEAVTPTVTTTYTATATGAGGTATASTTVTLIVNLAPTVTITASPTSITSGATSTLTIAATNATQVTVSGSDGSKYTLASGGGTQAVTPTSSTTYTATATGSGGTVTANATVTVTPNPAPVVTIAADPTSITSGSSSTLTVTATNATAVTVTGGGSTYNLPATGGTQAVSPTSTTTYTATGTGAGGTNSASATVTVQPNSSQYQLTVASVGTGGGTITSNPAGINCPGSCSANFANGTAVVLTAAPESGDTFAGWSGPCTGLQTCSVTLTANVTVTSTFENGTAGIDSLQHIIFFAQENRSLDNYFGAMRQYWAQNGIPDQSFDGLPQFNPTSGAAPLYSPPPALPGCNPADPMPSACVWDPTNTVASFHMISVCNENTSPSWNEAHVDYNFGDQVGTRPALNNGFVHTAAGDARVNGSSPPFYDVDGIRAMGYWNGTDMNYDYFMATNFATSDRFFQPILSRTELNREYLDAATSQGRVHQNGTDPEDTPLLTAKPIWEELQNAGITWKVYINPDGTGCAGPPYQASCLAKTVVLGTFSYVNTILADYPQNIAPISEYFTDLTDGTLPQVAEIYAASDAGLDEHGSVTDSVATNVQHGANYTSTLINALMESSFWQSSAFIFTFDESGGLYDHVSPQPAVSPDGIAPVDLLPADICAKTTGPICNFTWTGYRIPFTVISPYAKKNYVSHTVMDQTAILKFIEERFNLSPLNNRDAAQPDMTEFFDFNNPPWMSPPTPPLQNVKNPCYLNKLP